MNIKWDKLKYFYYVADERSLTKAAARLNMSSTTLSTHIKDLEYFVKQDLFYRKVQGMKLTRAGEELFENVKEIYEKTLNINNKFLEKNKELEGEVRIVTTPGIASSWLMQYIPGFYKKHPKIHLTIIGSLKAKDITLSGRMIKILPQQDIYYQIIQEYITTFNMYLYASKGYLKEYGVPKSINDLKNHKVINYEQFSAESLKGNTNWFMEGNKNSILTVDSALALYYAATNDMGIVELPDQYPLIKSSNLKCIKLREKNPTHDIYFSYLREYKKEETIKSFVNYLKDIPKN